jgi:hypothetical protein
MTHSSSLRARGDAREEADLDPRERHRRVDDVRFIVVERLVQVQRFRLHHRERRTRPAREGSSANEWPARFGSLMIRLHFLTRI